MTRSHGHRLRAGDHTPHGETAPNGKFGRMFPRITPLFCEDWELLDGLGAAMSEAAPGAETGDHPDLPAGFTFLGQFVDHDLTFDTTTLQEASVDPMALHNYRTPALDLDNLYGRGPDADPQYYQRDVPGKFQLGSARPLQPSDLSVELPFDLPRIPESLFAVVPDPRNDENLGVAQLHVLFLHFHNAVYEALGTSVHSQSPVRKTRFEPARELVILHYQWIVLHDYLPRVLDPGVLGEVRRSGSILFRCGGPFIPVEFAAAAYRFGHSLIREDYDYNRFFSRAGKNPASLGNLFAHAGIRGNVPFLPVTENWIIDWRRFFELDPEVRPEASRKIDPYLAPSLGNMRNLPPGEEPSLAKRNLRRGNMLGLPPGQSIARYFGYRALTPKEIATSGPDGEATSAADLHLETPLWYYILKEAQIESCGRRLGQVGSRIVAEVFVGLLERDSSSFLARKPGWKPVLPSDTPGDFKMTDLIRFALAEFPGRKLPI